MHYLTQRLAGGSRLDPTVPQKVVLHDVLQVTLVFADGAVDHCGEGSGGGGVRGAQGHPKPRVTTVCH